MENGAQIKYFFGIGTLVMLLTVLAVIVFVILHRNKLVKMRKNEAEYLLKVSREFDTRERKKIAADLHDSVCGDLSAIKNYIAILEGQITDARHRLILSEIKENMNMVLVNAKTISYNLMPPLLESSGFVAALDNYITGIRRMHGIQIRMSTNLPQGVLSTSQAYEAFRITQELFSNMLRHGQANTVEVVLKSVNNGFIIEINDDGKEYSLEEKAKSSPGMGLRNIYYRITLLKGNITQQYYQNSNHVQIVIPIQNVTNSNS
jgi:signal transduction histidine kinase